MLVHLRVRDLVLIDELDLTFAPGFNVFTGETGAGKSLVVTALDLILGRRAKSTLLRKGAAEAEIEGLFDIADEEEIKQRLIQAGLPVDDELLIRRVIPASGRHRCYVNGKLSSLGVLASLADGLASVMGQHEHQTLLEPTAQLELLDGFGKHDKLLTQMKTAYSALHEAAARYNDLKSKAGDRENRLDYIRYQLDEIEAVNPQPDELTEIEHQVGLLRHQGELLEAASRGADELYERDGSVFERLGSVNALLENAVRFDSDLAENVRQLEEAAVLVEETARTLSAYGSGLEADPEQLEKLEERQETLNKLTRKHGTDLEGVIALGDALAKELETLEAYDVSVHSVKENLDKCKKDATSIAQKLSSIRKRAAKKLGLAVTKEAKSLSFEKASFIVDVKHNEGDMPTAHGFDKVEFLVELNPGEGASPIRAAASGGELSRLMLAIRRVLAGVGPVGTYVFDEVDAGVGGAVASKVGRKLAEVAKHHQVICITHLPQISAMANAHFRVSKHEKSGRTFSRVENLNEKDRLEEVARMLGGEDVNAKIRAAAHDLITKAAGKG